MSYTMNHTAQHSVKLPIAAAQARFGITVSFGSDVLVLIAGSVKTPLIAGADGSSAPTARGIIR